MEHFDLREDLPVRKHPRPDDEMSDEGDADFEIIGESRITGTLRRPRQRRREIEAVIDDEQGTPLREMSPDDGCKACGCKCGGAGDHGVRSTRGRGSGSTTLSPEVLGNILGEYSCQANLM